MTRRLTLTALLLLLIGLPIVRAADAPALHANRIILRVADLKASIAFYRDRVGLPLQTTFDEFAVFGGDGLTVMLQQIERQSSAPSTGLAALTEVVLESPDVMKSYQEMKARGVAFLREPFAATVDGNRVLYAANFRDPDGRRSSSTSAIRSSSAACRRCTPG
jgi:catechol 2,3-dioxygenase-like lactoylglutathione lyase family enzyme